MAWLGRQGVSVQRVMTDNGSAYRYGLFRKVLADAGARPVRPRPCTPRTNGRAERFIQTRPREQTYARPYGSWAERALAIGPWTHSHNLAKPHARLKGRTPLHSVNNLRVNDDEAVARNPRGVFWDVTYERADERTRSPEIPH